MKVEDPAELAEEAEQLLANVEQRRGELSTHTPGQQTILIAVLQVGVQTMIARFQGVDLSLHGLQRWKGRLVAVRSELRELYRKQPQSQHASRPRESGGKASGKGQSFSKTPARDMRRRRK